MHPLILLWNIYLGISCLLCVRILLTKYLYQASEPSKLDAEIARAAEVFWQIPLGFLIFSDYVCGVEFDEMYICDLIEDAWRVLRRRAENLLIGGWDERGEAH